MGPCDQTGCEHELVRLLGHIPHVKDRRSLTAEGGHPEAWHLVPLSGLRASTPGPAPFSRPGQGTAVKDLEGSRVGRRHRRAEGLGCGAVGTGELIGVRLRGGGHRRAEGLGCGSVGTGELTGAGRWGSGHRKDEGQDRADVCVYRAISTLVWGVVCPSVCPAQLSPSTPSC